MTQRKDWRGTTRSVHSSDLMDRSLGVGDPNSASRKKRKLKETWSSVDLTGGGAVVGTVVEVDVPHDLGETPTMCTLGKVENAKVAGTFVMGNAVRPENWSHSHVHMSVQLISGSFDGCRASFRVQGS